MECQLAWSRRNIAFRPPPDGIHGGRHRAALGFLSRSPDRPTPGMSLQFLLDFATPEAHDAPVYALAATHEVVWSGAADGSVRSWDAVSGASLGAVRSPHKAAVTALSVSPALGLVLSSSMDGSVALWSIRDFAARQRLVPPPAPDADPLPPPDFSQQAPLECLAFVASIAQLPFPSESKHFPIGACGLYYAACISHFHG